MKRLLAVEGLDCRANRSKYRLAGQHESLEARPAVAPYRLQHALTYSGYRYHGSISVGLTPCFSRGLVALD